MQTNYYLPRKGDLLFGAALKKYEEGNLGVILFV